MNGGYKSAIQHQSVGSDDHSHTCTKPHPATRRLHNIAAFIPAFNLATNGPSLLVPRSRRVVRGSFTYMLHECIDSHALTRRTISPPNFAAMRPHFCPSRINTNQVPSPSVDLQHRILSMFDLFTQTQHASPDLTFKLQNQKLGCLDADQLELRGSS